MNIGVPKETAANERRVALTPEVAGRLAKSGWAVLVERGAGEAASFGDESYGTAGATLVAAAEVFGQSDVVLKVQPPSTRPAGAARGPRSSRRSSPRPSGRPCRSSQPAR